jgi:hypothetical protein
VSGDRTLNRYAASIRYEVALERDEQKRVPETFTIDKATLQWLGDKAINAFTGTTGLRLSQITKVVLVEVCVQAFYTRPRIEVDRDPTPRKVYVPLQQTYARRLQPRKAPRSADRGRRSPTKSKVPLSDGYGQDKCQFEVHFLNAFGDADIGRIWVSQEAPSAAGMRAFTF